MLHHCLCIVLMAVAAVVVMTPALAASPAVAVGAVLMIGAGNCTMCVPDYKYSI